MADSGPAFRSYASLPAFVAVVGRVVLSFDGSDMVGVMVTSSHPGWSSVSGNASVSCIFIAPSHRKPTLIPPIKAAIDGTITSFSYAHALPPLQAVLSARFTGMLVGGSHRRLS